MDQFNVRTAFVASLALSSVSVAVVVACGTNVTAGDCTSQCGNIDDDCIKTCSDDACKTKCNTNFQDCALACGKVTSTPADHAGGRKD